MSSIAWPFGDTSGIMRGIVLGDFSVIVPKNIIQKQPLEAIWWRIPPASPKAIPAETFPALSGSGT
ncbi:hypothetical protein, partial [Pseudoxanthomonas sp. KAs_5_3]|uniref:hypothetical protein n=1 Tax=Pseudoxanthomonas sp. KAs_5_3 TaxID=2067658 RepID=UPI001E5361EC